MGLVIGVGVAIWLIVILVRILTDDGGYSEQTAAWQTGTFTDPRDGKTYKTVKIGNQTWMARNLGYGGAHGNCYNGDPSNRDKYGVLYSWEGAQKACPPGWHLPSREEWKELIDFVGGEEVAGDKLKVGADWKNPYTGDPGNGTNDYGFSALPGGEGDGIGGFKYIKYIGFWWSSTSYSNSVAYCRSMNGSDATALEFERPKSNLYSVRCVQDQDVTSPIEEQNSTTKG